jgi:hypothetical protein
MTCDRGDGPQGSVTLRRLLVPILLRPHLASAFAIGRDRQHCRSRDLGGTLFNRAAVGGGSRDSAARERHREEEIAYE